MNLSFTSIESGIEFRSHKVFVLAALAKKVDEKKIF